MSPSIYQLTTTATLAALAAVATPTKANPLQELHWFVDQIAAQSATVGAQAHATFDDCGYGPLLADDVFDELADLDRRVERLCEVLATGPPSRGTLRRLERHAERVQRQAQELDAEIRNAIDDLRRRDLRQARRGLGGPAEIGGPVAFADPLATRGGLQIGFGRGGVQVNFASGHPALRHLPPGHPAARYLASRHVAARQFQQRQRHLVGYHDFAHQAVGRVSHRHRSLRPIGWERQPQADALCAQSERLLTMTAQLVAIVCR